MHQKHQKCLLLRKIQNASEMHHKYLFSPLPVPPDQFLNILCLLHIHPLLLHIILNSHISVPPTHPKTINFVKCKWLPTITLNFFPPSLHPPGPIIKHIMSVTHPPQLLHIILNSRISVPPTHPKTINFVKCKWLPTITLNFFPPSLHPPWTNY